MESTNPDENLGEDLKDWNILFLEYRDLSERAKESFSEIQRVMPDAKTDDLSSFDGSDLQPNPVESWLEKAKSVSEFYKAHENDFWYRFCPRD